MTVTRDQAVTVARIECRGRVTAEIMMSRVTVAGRGAVCGTGIAFMFRLSQPDWAWPPPPRRRQCLSHWHESRRAARARAAASATGPQ